MQLPVLYKKDSKGKLQFWEIGVDETIIRTIYGKVGGKTQTALEEITAGKNIGKKNETTPAQQAVAEATALWEKKKAREGYVESREDALAGKNEQAGVISPMLAHKFVDHKAKIRFPAVVSPKMDGFRCISSTQNNSTQLFSRKREEISAVPHLVKALSDLALSTDQADKQLVLDMELYNHELFTAGPDGFEKLASLTRSKTPKHDHEQVEAHIFDAPSIPGSFKDRWEWMQKNLVDLPACIVLVEQRLVQSEEEAMVYFGECIEKGYEGIMIRNLDSPYVEKRSYDIQKYKEFLDGEYEIVRVEHGVGKMAEAAVFVCKTVSGEEFNCTINASLADQKQYYLQGNSLIGKFLTIRYQNLTRTGVPRFLKGLRIRKD